MRFHVVLRYVALVCLLNSIFLLIASVVSAFDSDSALFPLLYTGIIALLFGVFPLIFVPATTRITNEEGLIIVTSSWLLSCLIGSLPYILWGGDFTFTDAWFESVSGYTTTGSTILENIERLPMGLLFWRSSTHWIGGIGIIIFVLSVLPFIGVSEVVLYRSEMSSLARDNFHLRARKAMQILAGIYLGLTGLETAALMACGMSLFDALNHAFATVATGGFSPRNASIAYYHSLSIEAVILIFMILSGIHFAMLFSVVAGNPRVLLRSTVVRYYVLALVVGTVIAAFNVYGVQYSNFAEALRYAAFQIVSVGTSTGFATADTSIWPAASQMLLIFFSLQCACAGSTSGGIKVDRMIALGKAVMKQLRQIRHPNAVIRIRIDQNLVRDEDVSRSVLYVCIYLIVVFISSFLLVSVGVDITSAFSGAVAAMGNVGPGLGSVGSTGNFSHIPSAGKWILTLTMLLGRLEIYALIILFMPRLWRRSVPA